MLKLSVNEAGHTVGPAEQVLAALNDPATGERLLKFLQRTFPTKARDHQWYENCRQEAMVNALRWADKFKGESNVQTWLNTIALNCGKMATRSEGRGVRIFNESQLVSRVANDDEQLFEVEDTSEVPDTETLALIDGVRKAVTEEIEHLPKPQGLVLRMQYFEGMESPEIAETLQENKEAIKSRIHRAKAALVKLLENRGIDKKAVDRLFAA